MFPILPIAHGLIDDMSVPETTSCHMAIILPENNGKFHDSFPRGIPYCFPRNTQFFQQSVITENVIILLVN